MGWRSDRCSDATRIVGRAASVRVGAFGLAALLLSGCTSSTELDATGADRNDGVRLPAWIAGGRALAAEEASEAVGDSPFDEADEPSSDTPGVAVSPSGDALVSDLVAAGLTRDQATCIDQGVGGSPELLASAITLVSAAAGGGTPPSLDTPTVAALLVAVGPCIADSPLGNAAAAIGSASASGSGSASSTAGGAPLPIPLDLTQIEAGVAEFQRALAAAQGELAKNVLQLLAAVGRSAPATSVPPSGNPVAPSTSGVTVPTTLALPVPLPVGLNLLRLVDRTAFVNQVATAGGDRKLAGCLYDRLALLTNDEIASLPPTGTNAALAEEILRSIFACATS